MPDTAGTVAALVDRAAADLQTPPQSAAVEPRSTSSRGVPAKAGNAGKLIGYESAGGIQYARYQAEQGTWVSASLAEQGYDKKYGKDVAYGAYLGLARGLDGRPLNAPDNIKPGEQYLIPVGRSASPGETPLVTSYTASRSTDERGVENFPKTKSAPRGTDARVAAGQRSVRENEGTPALDKALQTARAVNWPFRASAGPDVIASYIDNRTRKLSINGVLGVVYLALDNGTTITIPLAMFRSDLYNLVPIFPVASSKSAALGVVERVAPASDLAKMGFVPCAFYRHESGAILPTVLNPQTLPNIWATYREALILERDRLNGWADAFEKLLQWYTVARIPIPALRAGSAGFVARSLARELYQSTAAAANPGQQMLRAASILSDMRGLTAAQKVEVILEFFKRIGFLAKPAVDEGTAIILIAENELSAFKILKDTGQILYGRFNRQTLEYVFEALR